ncbi:MAG: HAD-IB family phosphatase [Planctomycetota bacterium]|nr:HAD-IB family phosphatase [Planctomycetaceae bacterium]MDQ3329112.1 HAD-IB family phosphatase [Planctomycetota bacterium]
MSDKRMLITDFDGTLTRRDFYELVAEHLLPADAPDFWGELRAGRRTLFDTLHDMFAYVPAGEAKFIELTHQAGFEADLVKSVQLLRDAGWEVIVVSAGCRWYIDRLLREAGVELEVHANPGHIDREGRLIMERPGDSPYQSVETGVDKAAVVRKYQAEGYTVAYAGDGPPDLPAALLVSPELRFARSDLADRLTRRGEGFRPFKRWAEIAETLANDP